MPSFSELVASRRDWIDSVLQPWCRQATRQNLLLAEADWKNLAGIAPAEKTLWFWAWQRFPTLCQSDFMTLNETEPLEVTLFEGTLVVGYPDARLSQQGMLMLIGIDGRALTPISIDQMKSVRRVEPSELPPAAEIPPS